ncbi:MAG: O-antigen ligase family protein [Candidatus Liptonbacteria bacterium]|nr:O-antigen ligase family protein [Candidatus Liptonbacteria bacterium]
MLLKISKFFLYASVFSVVVVLPSTFFPFIGGKYYFFRICTELALVFLLLWWAFGSPSGSLQERFKKIYRQPLFVAVSAFVLFYLLASLFAYSPASAFWSNYERGEGGFQMLHYYLFFVLLLLVFQDQKEWKKIFMLSVIAASLMILYGIPFNSSLFHSFITPYSESSLPGVWAKLTDTNARFQGSLGNPAYVAPYLLFAIFYAAYLWFTSPAKKKWFIWATHSFLIIFFLLFFYFSRTRGAFLGLLVALLYFFVHLFFTSRGKAKKWFATGLTLSALLAGLLVWVSFYVSPLCAKTTCSSFYAQLANNRLLNISPGDQTFKTRFWTWNSAWQGFKERPLLGWGPENFSTVFDRHFDPRHYVPGTNSETWFDRAHSVFFDYLTETGIFGLLSYLGIFVVFFWHIFSRRKTALADHSPESTSLPHQSVVKGMMLALSIGYLVQGLALFDVLPIYLNLFLFLAFSSYQFLKSYEPKP